VLGFDPHLVILTMKTKSILIVDDDRSMRKGLAFELTDLGYKVTEAGDGAEAIELIKSKHFDLVISDLIMPKADGLQVYHTVRNLRPHTKFLSMTAFVESKEAREAQRIFKENFLMKPLQLNELLHRINMVFEE